MQNLQIDTARMLLSDVYVQLKNKEISSTQAKIECDILCSIIKAIEISDLKKEIINLKSLLTQK
ncbi:hypothetical protein N9C35_05235 [Flavobacteriaceae bacterium]|jgi:hypothetical protein|nr:hypothetical protein [Flavobacteriaceae bacterium]